MKADRFNPGMHVIGMVCDSTRGLANPAFADPQIHVLNLARLTCVNFQDGPNVPRRPCDSLGEGGTS